MTHKCNRGWHSERWSDDQCRVCWLKRDPGSRRYVGAEVTAAPSKSPRAGSSQRISLATVAPCVHRGELLSRPSSCNGTWRYSCDVVGSCSLATCESCEHYRTGDGDPVRHLAYYVYPVSGNGTWQRNMEQLLERIDLFNGRRVVAIATSSSRHKLDSPDEVRKAFDGEDLDILLVPHGARKLGEVTAFVPMMTRLAHLPGYTFYAHAKGVTKHPLDPAVHRWTTLMYKANLDRWDLVEKELATHAITGAFRKLGPAFGGHVSAHYTGTFYWFRNDDVFKRDWRNVPARYGGTEMWPNNIARDGETGCHFGDASGLSMYNPAIVTEMEKKWTALTNN